MKVVKAILVLAVPVLIVVNLWRLVSFGSDFETLGFKSTIDYLSTYRGFRATYSVWTSMTTSFSNADDVGDVLYGIFQVLAAPISIPTAILGDIIYHIVFFFGWIFSDIGGGGTPSPTYDWYDYTSSIFQQT